MPCPIHIHRPEYCPSSRKEGGKRAERRTEMQGRDKETEEERRTRTTAQKRRSLRLPKKKWQASVARCLVLHTTRARQWMMGVSSKSVPALSPGSPTELACVPVIRVIWITLWRKVRSRTLHGRLEGQIKVAPHLTVTSETNDKGHR